MLHRLGRNKDALKAIKGAGNIESAEAKHLVAQIVGFLVKYLCNIAIQTWRLQDLGSPVPGSLRGDPGRRGVVRYPHKYARMCFESGPGVH